MLFRSNAAVDLIDEFDDLTFAILKHNNACGLASRATVLEAWKDALAGDPVSARLFLLGTLRRDRGGLFRLRRPSGRQLLVQQGKLLLGHTPAVVRHLHPGFQVLLPHGHLDVQRCPADLPVVQAVFHIKMWSGEQQPCTRAERKSLTASSKPSH